MLIKYAFVYFLTYLIDIAFLQILECFKLNIYLAQALVIPLIAVITFLLNDKFVFMKNVENISLS